MDALWYLPLFPFVNHLSGINIDTLGMACRLLADLGLHEPPSPSDEGADPAVVNAQLRILGSCAAFEGVWCMYLGRATSIPRSIVTKAATALQNYKGPGATTLTAWIGLCAPMTDVCDILNRSSPLDASAKARLHQLDLDMQQWYRGLDPNFAYDESNIADLDPTAYGVHMQYCKVQILMHQTLHKEENIPMGRSPTFGQGTVHHHNPHEQAIYDSSLRIVRLLLTYRQVHGPEKIPSVMLDNVSLGLVNIISHYLRYPYLIEYQPRDIQWLRLAIENMRSICPHFPIVGRMLTSLQVLVKGTSLADMLNIEASPINNDSSPMRSPERLVRDIEMNSEMQHSLPGDTTSINNTTTLLPDLPQPQVSSNIMNSTEGDRISAMRSVMQQQRLTDDPGDLSASLLCWSDPQTSSFWPQSNVKLFNRFN